MIARLASGASMLVAELAVYAAVMLGVGTVPIPDRHPTIFIAAHPDLAWRIRGCESHGSPTARGDYRARNRSGASGAWQIMPRTWRRWARVYGKDVHASRWARAGDAPPAVQDTVAIRALRAQGSRPWSSSKACWA